MREFLKAFVLIFVLFVIGLGVLRWAPIPFPVVQDLKQSPVLKDTLFPILDKTVSSTRDLAKTGIDQVPFLKEQKWLTDLFAGSSNAVAENESSDGGRAPAAASNEEPTGPRNVIAGGMVKGAIGELLGSNTEILSESRIVSTTLAPVEVKLPQILSLYLKENSQVILWTVKSSDNELFLVEVKTGAIEVKKSPAASSEVAVSLKSGAYKKLKAGERWIAGVRSRGRSDLEGFQVGSRSELNTFLENLKKAPAVPSSDAAPAKQTAQSLPGNSSRAPAGLDDDLQ